MRKIIDVTGVIDEGMWNYGHPFPEVKIKPLPPVPWVKGDVYCEIFEGIHSQTGTYLETPAHFFGNTKCYLLIDVPVEKLVSVPCVVLNIGRWDMDKSSERRAITIKDLESCLNAKCISKGDAILVGTGWGRYWFNPDYLNFAPYFSKDAMEWLIEKRPFILGSDSPRWENLEKPQGFFPDFYNADILMLAPLVNLENCSQARSRLTVLPIKFPKTSAAPCRAIVAEEE